MIAFTLPSGKHTRTPTHTMVLRSVLSPPRLFHGILLLILRTHKRNSLRFAAIATQKLANIVELTLIN